MKRKFLGALLTLVVGMLIVFACSSDDIYEELKNRSPYSEQTDTIPDELSDYLNEIPAEDLTEADMTLENGNNVIELIQAYDSAFVNENPWILKFDNIEKEGEENETRGAKRSQGNITGNAGIVNLKNTIISQMILGSAFFLNNSNGIATNKVVQEKIANQDQVGLWYKWGGKIWDEYSYPSPGGEPTDGEELECYGLDCSGLVYAAMNRIGFGIPVLSANSYYNVSIWNNALKVFIPKKSSFLMTSKTI